MVIIVFMFCADLTCNYWQYDQLMWAVMSEHIRDHGEALTTVVGCYVCVF